MNFKIFIVILSLVLITACSVQDDTLKDKEIEDLKQQLQEKTEEIEQLKTQLENNSDLQEEFQETGIDISTWNPDELVRAIATKNKKFETAEWFRYEYTNNERYYYDLEGPIFPDDPFYDIVYSKKDRELNVNFLRIFNIDSGLNYNDENYIDYVQNINKQTIINSSLTCTEETTCRNINLIVCRINGAEFYSWYTYPHLFEARNDNGETYEAFKEFYCNS